MECNWERKRVMKPNSLIPSKYRHFIEQNAWMVGGNILFAIGVNMIVTPLGLYNGGFMGLAQLLRLLCEIGRAHV